MPHITPAAPPRAEPAMEYVEGEVSISETGHQRFELSGKHAIPSGNVPKTLHLDSFELKLERAYYWSSTQPKLIMTHELENEQYFLLPGNAKVFIAGEYISQSYLDLIGLYIPELFHSLLHHFPIAATLSRWCGQRRSFYP